ncbi:uncharacterized protein MELLADRAFT_109962 [Melampsora larici-populina 98AG31]|uniref:FAD dependent oxidoreductase domain-containing protein n=2 Tax=Melampsora laricis-populina TaxID=203908 RepID=F4RY72_MELLP|nr:uncharacterized protein MELLADRAFT_109962 [Melampsora larici-populina 98AG31]ALM22241.1 D-amino acid oxidase [Melampsora laricis-populina]EGG02628.1 hypothetical protein MELLADRAFT_109962 [Melampsora larici-populina 98AG31]
MSFNPEHKSEHLNIIGSGVLGLTCALEIAKEKGRYTITIITADADSSTWSPSAPPKIEKVAEDFASPWAGAYWQSFVATRDPKTFNEKRLQDWEKTSFKELWKISETDKSIVMVKYLILGVLSPRDVFVETSQHYSSKPIVTNILMKNLVTMSYLGTPICVQRLAKVFAIQLCQMGVRIVHHRLNSLAEAFEGNNTLQIPRADIVINASGLGAATLLGVEDKSVHPIRGQLVLVKPPQPICFSTRDSSRKTYIISRPSVDPEIDEEVILGGCYQADNFDLSVDPDLTNHILCEAFQTRPDLSSDGTLQGIHVLKEVVALRPARKDGARLEVEKVVISGENKHAVHCYGIGGAGFQSSYGMAQEALGLIKALREGRETV